MKTCPTTDQLVAFALGKLAEDEAVTIAGHLDACTVCDSAVSSLDQRSDSFVSELRRPTSPEEFIDESEYRQAADLIAVIAKDPSPSIAEFDQTVELVDLGTLGQYKLLSKLGEGGMGAVYKALHTRLEKVVAVKVLPAGRLKDEAAVARFDREMKAVGKLDHPNIVRASDAGEVDGTHFLVMEYVAGYDLSEIVRRIGPLPVADACELIRQTAVGLQHVHEHGLVHRDIKPSNLMVSRMDAHVRPGPSHKFGQPGSDEGVQPTVKILDLGLALLQDQHAEGSRELTASGQMMGTLDYMAPEQGDDSHEVDIRADIYSLGATLYKLLSGEAPFAGTKYNTPVKKMMALATEDVAPIRDKRPEVPQQLAEVIHAMLAKQAAGRPATPAEVANLLAPFAVECDIAGLLATVSGEPVSASKFAVKPGSTGSQLASASCDTVPVRMHAQPIRSRRFWWPVAVAAALAGVLLLAVLFSIRTPNGTITVEVPNPANTNIQVQVSQGGKQVAVIDAQSKWKIELDEGEYRVELSGGTDSFEIRDDKVTVRRNQEAVVTVTLRRDEPTRPGTVQPAPNASVVKAFTPDDKLITQDGVTAAEGGWKITATDPATIRLFEVPDPGVENCLVTYRAKIKCQEIQQRAYLEMWVRMPGGGEYFSKGFHNAVSGTNDWSTVEIPFRLEKGQRPDLIKLSVVVEGKGTLWIKDIEILRGELPTATASLPDLLAAVSDTFKRKVDAAKAPEPSTSVKPQTSLVVSANLRTTCDGHDEWFGGVAFSPDGKLLLDSGADHSIRVWDIATGQLVKQLRGHTRSVHHIAFSPEGNVLASSACGEEIRMWTLDQTEPIATLRGHLSCTPCVTFSPDGDTLASCSLDNTIKLWDVKSATVRKTLRGDFSYSDYVALSGDGRFVAAASRKGLLTIWDAHSGERLHSIQAHDLRTWCVAFSPDSRALATCSTRDGTIRLWNPETGDRIAVLETESFANRRVLFSHAGDLLAAGSHDGTVRIWDAATYRLLSVIDAHQDAIDSMAFSQDGDMLATASRDRTVKLWDIRAERLPPGPEGELRRLVGHTSRVTSLACSWDSKRILSAADDRTIRLWDVAAGGQIQQLAAPAVNIECLAISSDGQLAVSGDEQHATLWNLKAGEVVHKLEDQKFVQSAVFSRYDESVLVGGLDQIRLYDVATGKRIREYHVKEFKSKTKRFSGLVFLDDGRSFLSFGLFSGGVIQLWDIDNSEPLRTTKLKGLASGVQKPRFSPDGRLVAIAATDTSVGVWDTETGEAVKMFDGIEDKVYSVAFSQGGRYVAAGSRDHKIRVWDVQTGDLFHAVSAETPCTNQIAFAPNGNYLVSAGGNLRRGEPGSEGDCALHVWRLPTLDETPILPERKPPVLWSGEVRRFAAGPQRSEGIGFSPDGRRILSGSQFTIDLANTRGNVKIWNVETGEAVHDCIGHAAGVYSVAFSPDGRWAASLGLDRLRVWDVATGQQVHELPYDAGQGGAVLFTSDGKRLIASNAKRAATVWDVASGSRLALAKAPADIQSFTHSAILPRGDAVLYGSGTKLVVWDIEKKQERQSSEIDAKRLNSLCVSPEGRYAFAGGEPEFFRLWELESGKDIPKPAFISGKILGSAFSPDSRYAAVGLANSAIVVWEVASGTEIARYQADKDINLTLAFSPDGNYLLSTGGKVDQLGRGYFDGNYDLHLWQLPKLLEPDTAIDLLELIDPVRDAAKQGAEIKDGVLRLVRGQRLARVSAAVIPAGSYELLLHFTGDEQAGPGGVILPVADRQVLLSLGATEDKKFQVGLDRVGGKANVMATDVEIARADPHELLIQVRVTGEQAAILAKLNGQKVVEWQGATKDLSLAEAWTLPEPRTFGFAGGNSFAAINAASLTMRDGSAKVLRPKPTRLELSVNAALRATFSDHESWFGGVTFSPDGKILASGDKRHMTVLRNVETGEIVKEMKGHSRPIHKVRFSPDGKLLASTACNEEMRLWEVARGEEIATMRGHIMCAPWLDWSPDGQTLVSCSRDKTVKLWDIASASIRKTLVTTNAERDCVDISPDGSMIASGTRSGAVSIWDAEGNELRTFQAHNRLIGALEFSPDSKLLAVNGDDGSALIFDLATGEKVQTLTGPPVKLLFQSLTWSPDGRVLAIGGGEDPKIWLWEVETGRQLATLEGHTQIIFSLDFSPDGRLLASGSRDETIRVWELKYGYAPSNIAKGN